MDNLNYYSTSLYSFVRINVTYSGKFFSKSSLIGNQNKRIQHHLSNLADATAKFPRPCQQEIISRLIRGDYGSADVLSNQIW